jgi:predicted Rossmann fold flavoprotein
MLFTHFGISGPAVLNPSEIVAELLEKFPTVTLRIDFTRHHSVDDLAALLRRWQQQHGKKLIKTMLGEIIPQRLAEKFCELLAISFEQTCANLTSAQIHQLIERLKVSRFTIYDTRGFKEAMVTAGGVALTEVSPNTLESKLVPGLYLVGEVLDLTGPSGGYNLQLAFSTGHLAGESAAAALRS